jgi:hypothetical protein
MAGYGMMKYEISNDETNSNDETAGALDGRSGSSVYLRTGVRGVIGSAV